MDKKTFNQKGEQLVSVTCQKHSIHSMFSQIVFEIPSEAIFCREDIATKDFSHICDKTVFFTIAENKRQYGY